ncbi:MAG: hypothetical protein E6I38_03875 [Chloroflexi bacterium]|nr:MAG: hypothetical protein E6I38_03875 [Chloroflexota bacterium]
MSSRTLLPALALLAIAAFLAILAVTANGPDRALGQQVTPTPTATATAAATPTGTPTSVLVTATNGTGVTADDLHFYAHSSSMTLTVEVPVNAPGCATPTGSAGTTTGLDFTFAVNVTWPTTCVDSGESVTVKLSCPGYCSFINTFGCEDWTLSRSVIGSPCPTPNCAGQPCCGGLPCPTATASPTPGGPTATPTATPTPGPAGHDARLTRVSGVPKNVRLLPGEVVADSGSIVVANQSTHSDTIGVYVDVMAPSAGGCTPNGRVLETTVTLAAGAKTTIPVPVSYSCADPAAANGLSYTWVAVADHGGDDLASCGPGALQSLACFNALADDDQDSSDNRVSRNGPRVVAQ